MEGIENVKEVSLDTAFGKPSDNYIVGTLNGVEVAFLSRHGRGHVVNPSEVNYRANIMGMKMLGVGVDYQRYSLWVLAGRNSSWPHGDHRPVHRPNGTATCNVF